MGGKQMNKQEAIKKAEFRVIYPTEVRPNLEVLPLEEVKNIISQIHEPQKPVVPKFVAEWIEDHKGDYSKWDEEARADFVFRAINDLFRFGEGLSFWDFTINEKISEWTTKNAYEFITAILFGYTVEKEKLYTVEIPDPHGMYKIRYLFRNGMGSMGNIRIGGTDYRDIFLDVDTHLTEAEIKQDFDFLWQFAKPVQRNYYKKSAENPLL